MEFTGLVLYVTFVRVDTKILTIRRTLDSKQIRSVLRGDRVKHPQLLKKVNKTGVEGAEPVPRVAPRERLIVGTKKYS